MSFNWDDVRTALIEAEGDIHAAAEILASAKSSKKKKTLTPPKDVNEQVIDYIIATYTVPGLISVPDIAKALAPLNNELFVETVLYDGTIVKPVYDDVDKLATKLGNRKTFGFNPIYNGKEKKVGEYIKKLELVSDDTKRKNDSKLIPLIKTPKRGVSKSSSSSSSSSKPRKITVKRDQSQKGGQTTIPQFNPEASRSGKTPQVSDDEGPISGLDVDVKAYIEQEVIFQLRRSGRNPERMRMLASRIKKEYEGTYNPDEIQAYFDKVNTGQSENAIEAVDDIQNTVRRRLEKKSKTTQMEDIDSIAKKYPQFPRESIESYYNYILKADSQELTEQELVSDDEEESLDFIDQGDDVPSDIDVMGDLRDLPPDPLQFGEGTYVQYFTTNFGKRIRIISDTASGDVITMNIVQEQPIESDAGELQTGFTVRSRR